MPRGNNILGKAADLASCPYWLLQFPHASFIVTFLIQWVSYLHAIIFLMPHWSAMNCSFPHATFFSAKSCMQLTSCIQQFGKLAYVFMPVEVLIAAFFMPHLGATKWDLSRAMWKYRLRFSSWLETLSNHVIFFRHFTPPTIKPIPYSSWWVKQVTVRARKIME